MGKSKNRRFYWIKLKEDFFDLPTIDFLQEQKNGCEYIVLYLRLCLIAINTEGRLVRQIGEMVIPYDAKKISDVTKIKCDTVVVALEAFRRIGLIEEQPDGVLTIPSIGEMVGSESEVALYHRERRKKLKSSANSECSTIPLIPASDEQNICSGFANANLPQIANANAAQVANANNKMFANANQDGLQTQYKRLENREEDDDDDIYRAGVSAHTRTHSIEENSELAKVLACYQDNIHPISSQIERDRIVGLFDDFGAVWLTEAINVSAINHAGTVRYVEAVLESWRSSGSKEPWREERKNGSYAEKRGRNAERKTKPDISDAEGDGIDWSRFDNTYSGAEQAGTSDGT